MKLLHDPDSPYAPVPIFVSFNYKEWVWVGHTTQINISKKYIFKFDLENSVGAPILSLILDARRFSF